MNLDGYVIVFDLDDTLISELEYQRSGIASVEAYIGLTYTIDFNGHIQAAFDQGVQDLWGWACRQLNLPASVKESFLWVYRLHLPDLQLSGGVADLLRILRGRGAQLAILSDGRSITQRLKLKSVGLEGIPSFISEEYGAVKPDSCRYLAVEDRWPQRKYVYIGDNPQKDFKAPNEMGWLTLGALWVSPRVHHSYDQAASGYCLPRFWCHNPSDVLPLIEMER